MKKWIAAISAVVLAFTGSAAAVPAVTAAAEESAASTYNYGEALQKSMFFYEVQQSGVKPDWNEVCVNSKNERESQQSLWLFFLE